jgi:hypothetical protein
MMYERSDEGYPASGLASLSNRFANNHQQELSLALLGAQIPLRHVRFHYQETAYSGPPRLQNFVFL